MGQARFTRRTRWAVPAAAVTAAGLVIAGSLLASAAQAAPVLPARGTAQLLADVAGNYKLPASLSGVIEETASLGLPQLPESDGGSSGYSLLAGSHTFSVWYAGPAHVRIAVPAQFGETDLRQDGRQVWLWDSTTDTATRIVLPASAGPHAAAGSVSSASATFSPTPQQAARMVLAAVGPTTTVSVQQNVMVAGQAAYQLALAPKASGSLVSQVRIAIDARGYLPLRVQVFARGAASPAYQVGFTSLSLARPAASNFAFTPPPGAKVRTVRVPAGGAGPLGSQPGAAGSAVQTFGSGPGAVPPGASKREIRILTRLSQQESALIQQYGGPEGVPWELRQGLQKSLRAAFRLGLLPKGLHKGTKTAVPAVSGTGAAAGWAGSPPAGPMGALGDGALAGLPPGAAPTVIGTGWLSVIAARLDPSSLAALQPGASPPTTSFGSASAQGSSAAYSSTLQISAPAAGPALAALRALLRAAAPVHGSWGSGRLLRTSLLSVLFTSSGRVLIGAVTPAVLYRDAAKAQ